jgi:hypothetical protein
LFSQTDKSKRAEKTLELAIHKIKSKELKRCLSSQSQVFSGLDESKSDKLTLEPILGYFHDLDES